MADGRDATDSAATGVGAPPGETKLLGLEVIRFMSACSVLIWHYQNFYYIADKPGPNYIVSDQPLYFLLAPFYDAGYFGVQIFWCISGFIFFFKYRDMIAERRIKPFKFFVLRMSRLYPLHFATLILVAVLQAIYLGIQGHYFVYIYNDVYHFILQLFFASNWGFQEGFSFNGPIWSISVEVLIYCLFFVSLRYLGKTLWVCLIAIAIAGIAKVTRVDSPIFDCLGFFYIGGMTCLIRNYISRTGLHRALQVAAWVLIPVVPVAAIAAGAFSIPIFDYVFWLAYAPLLLYVGAANFNLEGRARTLVEAAGNMTYSSYLIHFPLQIAIASTCAAMGFAIPVDSTAFLVGFVLTTLVLAYFIFELFEKPAQNYIRARFR